MPSSASVSPLLTIGLFMPDDVTMATKTLIVDDLDGSDGASTVSFSLGNTAYEIDLSKKNKAAMEKKLSKFTAAARKAGSSGRHQRHARRDSEVAFDRWVLGGGSRALAAASSWPGSGQVRRGAGWRQGCG